jgi:hypothetical protein
VSRIWRLLALGLTLVLVLGACGSGDEEGSLTDLQLVGIDFELDSIILANAGTDVVATEGLWVYQDGEVSEFNVFLIEPRTEILFSVRDIGGLENDGGEIALFSSDSFSDPESLIEYVAWGESGHSRADVAVDAGQWSEDGSVETSSDILVILRADPTLTGPEAWVVSDVIP